MWSLQVTSFCAEVCRKGRRGRDKIVVHCYTEMDLGLGVCEEVKMGKGLEAAVWSLWDLPEGYLTFQHTTE